MRQRSRFSSRLAGLVIFFSLSNLSPGERGTRQKAASFEEIPLLLSLVTGIIVLDAPWRREEGSRATADLILSLLHGKDIPPIMELGSYHVVEQDSPEARGFLSAIELLHVAGMRDHARHLEDDMIKGKIRMVEGLENLGFRALYDRATGIIYLSRQSLLDPGQHGIGPPGPAHDASGRIALAGHLCHESGHKWNDLGEEEAYALEEAFYRRLLSRLRDPDQKEGVRRCLYLFYNARKLELGLPVPPGYTEADFKL